MIMCYRNYAYFPVISNKNLMQPQIDKCKQCGTEIVCPDAPPIIRPREFQFGSLPLDFLTETVIDVYVNCLSTIEADQ